MTRTEQIEALARAAAARGDTLGEFLDKHTAREPEPQEFAALAEHLVRLIEIFNEAPAPHNPVAVALEHGLSEVVSSLDGIERQVERIADHLEDQG